MLEIRDLELYFDGAETAKVLSGTLTAKPLVQPYFQTVSGTLRQDQGAQRVSVPDPVTGQASVFLPWPSESTSADTIWQIKRVSGVIYQGRVPEGLTGPLTYQQMLSLYGVAYGWQVVSSPTTPTVIGINGSDGTNGLPTEMNPWNSAKQYTAGMGTTDNGSSWLALTTVPPGIRPPADGIENYYWRPIALGGTAVGISPALVGAASGIAPLGSDATLELDYTGGNLLAVTPFEIVVVPATAIATGSPGVLYTVTAANSVLTELRFFNLTGQDANVTVTVLSPSGTTITLTYGLLIPGTYNPSADSPAPGIADVSIEVPLRLTMLQGDVISAVSTVAGVTCEIVGGVQGNSVQTIRGLEAFSVPTGSPAVLTISLDRWYLNEILLTNKNAAPVVPNINILHANGAISNLVVDEPIPPGAQCTTSFAPNYPLRTGDKLSLQMTSGASLEATLTLSVACDNPAPGVLAAEHTSLYNYVSACLDRATSTLITGWVASGTYTPTYCTDLSLANAAAGTALIDKVQGIAAVNSWASVIQAKMAIDAIKQFGCGAITVACGYPIMSQTFRGGAGTNADFSYYNAFYNAVFAYAHSVGLKVIAKAGVVFANSPFSTLVFDYTGMTLSQWTTEMAQMVLNICKLGPDYVTTLTESDTNVQLLTSGGADAVTFGDVSTGLNTPTGFANFVSGTMPSTLNKNGAKVIAAPPAWFTTSFISTVLTLLTAISGYDGAALHVYPWYSPDSLFASLVDVPSHVKQIVQAMQVAGKVSVVDEFWLDKVYGDEAGNVAATQNIFRRDAFTFYAALDNRLMALMKSVAQRQGISIISAFWGLTQWFAQLDYTPGNSQLTYAAIQAIQSPLMLSNISAYSGHTTGIAAGNIQYLSTLGKMIHSTITTP